MSGMSASESSSGEREMEVAELFVPKLECEVDRVFEEVDDDESDDSD